MWGYHSAKPMAMASGSSGQELSGAGKVHEALTKDWCTWKEFDVKEKRKEKKKKNTNIPHTKHRALSFKLKFVLI